MRRPERTDTCRSCHGWNAGSILVARALRRLPDASVPCAEREGTRSPAAYEVSP